MAIKKQTQDAQTEMANVSVLNAMLQKVNGHADHIDVQTNIIVALSSAVFVFSAQQIVSNGLRLHPYLLVLMFFSACAALTGLLAVNPPPFMRKRGQMETLLYHRHIAALPSSDAYGQELAVMTRNEEKIIREYAREIYNISKYYYLPKRALFNLSRNFLVVGFFVSFCLLAFQIG